MLHLKGLIPVVIVIVIFVIAAGLVGATWYYKEHKDEVTNSDFIVNSDTNGDNSELANYKNSVWGFSFQYPADWAVVKDDLPKEIRTSNSPNEDLIIGKDVGESKTPRPSIILIINPDGFGPLFPDVKYTIERTENGFKIIDEEQIKTEANFEPGFYQIQAIETYGDQRFMIFFNIDDDQKEGWDVAVKNILSTFKFGETQSIDISNWQTYNSQDSSLKIFKELYPAFSVKFPNNWLYGESLGGLTISDMAIDGSAPYIQIDLGNASLDGDLIEECKKRSGWGSPDNPIPDFVKYDEEKEITIDGITSAYVSYYLESTNNVGERANQTTVCTPVGDQSLVVWAQPRHSELVINYLENILATIKFHYDSSDWESYSNKEWQLSFNYPPFMGALVDETEEPNAFGGKVVTRIYTPGQNPYLDIFIIDDSVLNVKKWIEDFAKNEPAKTIDWSNVQINGVSAEKGTYSYNQDNTYFYNQYVFTRLDKTWVVGTFSWKGQEDPAIQNLEFN